MAKTVQKRARDVEEVSVAAAKNRFSELLGRVAYGGATVLISRRGKPMAKLVPATTGEPVRGLAEVTGWLEEDDPFFAAVDDIVRSRRRHVPRALRRPARGR